jgi:hypothetical protein
VQVVERGSNEEDEVVETPLQKEKKSKKQRR